jgi:protein SCO1/2
MRPPQRLAFAALLIVLAIGLALALSLGQPKSKHPSAGPTGATALAGSPFVGAEIPGQRPGDFTLTDLRGRRVALSDYRGQVTILTFCSTDAASASTSRLIAQQIRGALEELHTRVPALAVSLDPEADSHARVSDFLRRVSLTGRLDFLTGTPNELRAVWRAYAIVPPTSAHQRGPDRAAYVLLIDQRGVQRVRFYVEQLTPEGLSHDIRKLEAG